MIFAVWEKGEKMRPIDACALQEEYKARHSGKRLLLIDVAPTVDAVPVVRCKDCTYSRPFGAVVFLCTRYADSRLKTDYCSYGKRKEGR